MKSNNTIEINGKLYDAKTGTPLAAHAKKPRTAPAKVAAKSIDGFSRSTHAAPAQPAKTAAKPAKTKPLAATRTAPHSVKRKAKRSTTLHRSTVKAPVLAGVAVASPQPKTAPKLTSPAIKHADAARLERAGKVAKSSTISKFNRHIIEPAVTTASEALLTRHLALTHAIEAPAELAQEQKRLSTKEQLIKKAVANATAAEPKAAAPKKSKATKHTAAKKTRARHIGRYASTAFAALLLAGYVAYLNVPSISMKVAAHRAGFAATLPTYKPAGYSLRGPINVKAGQVSVDFKSNTDDRSFSLKQQPTTWDSTALLENYVTRQTPNYLTYQNQGLTIYLYDGSNAAWVNAGKLYQLEAKNSQLDTSQILKLATSV